MNLHSSVSIFSDILVEIYKFQGIIPNPFRQFSKTIYLINTKAFFGRLK